MAAADEPQRTSGGITTNGHHAPAQPQEPAQPLEDEREVMRDFRDAFSHLTRPEDSSECRPLPRGAVPGKARGLRCA